MAVPPSSYSPYIGVPYTGTTNMLDQLSLSCYYKEYIYFPTNIEVNSFAVFRFYPLILSISIEGIIYHINQLYSPYDSLL